MIVVAAVFLLLASTAETRATFTKNSLIKNDWRNFHEFQLDKESLSRTRRTVTGLRTKCIPYLKKFCQWFTVRGVTKRFCIVKTFYSCTALD